MQKQLAVNDTGASLRFSECWDVDDLSNRYGLSRSTARNSVWQNPKGCIKPWPTVGGKSRAI